MIRKLSACDETEFMNLVNIVEKKLPRPDFFIGMTQEEKDNLFNYDFCIPCGVFQDGRLVAVSCLYHHQENDVADYLSLPKNDCAEIGHCMVLPEYRGNNLMLDLNKILETEAKRLNIKYLIATAHPENISSNSSLLKLGMKNIDRFMRNKDYLRNIFFKEII